MVALMHHFYEMCGSVYLCLFHHLPLELENKAFLLPLWQHHHFTLHLLEFQIYFTFDYAFLIVIQE